MTSVVCFSVLQLCLQLNKRERKKRGEWKKKNARERLNERNFVSRRSDVSEKLRRKLNRGNSGC